MISIHALREEGDFTSLRVPLYVSKFLSTPSARRATYITGVIAAWFSNFYPRPPRGGRLLSYSRKFCAQTFLSTPSARRATAPICFRYDCKLISIHALREEGDHITAISKLRLRDFYPRPPRGGRLYGAAKNTVYTYFYPRPPRGGRPLVAFFNVWFKGISIHALREEGDMFRFI